MKGFEILQNIEDKSSDVKHHGRTSDALTDPTEYTRADDDTNGIKNNGNNDNDDDVQDTSFYCDEYGSENEECDESDKNFHYSSRRVLNNQILRKADL